MALGRSFAYGHLKAILISVAVLALATSSQADGVRSTTELPPVDTTLPLHAPNDPTLASVNPVFVLSPDEAQRKLKEGASLVAKSTTAAAYLHHYQSDAKMVEGPADGSGWAHLLGVDGNAIIVQTLAQDKTASANDSAPSPLARIARTIFTSRFIWKTTTAGETSVSRGAKQKPIPPTCATSS